MRNVAWNYSSESIFCIQNYAGAAALVQIRISDGAVTELDTAPYTWLRQLSASPISDELALIASSPRHAERVLRWDGQRWRALAYNDAWMLPEGTFSAPQQISWKGKDGDPVYGLFYPPHNPDYDSAGKPPLIVAVHGGPTSQSVLEFPRDAHFFTSRGYAFLDVNYRGSSGYGRSYQEALRGQWGILDTADIAGGARAAAERGLADGEKMAIYGGSAGGYAVLCALMDYPGVFKAGVALYPVTDLFSLALDTHKFEAHYTDSLVGVLPDAAEIFRQRSPLFQAQRIKYPIAIFHGADDRAVPISQSEAIVKKLKENGVPHLFQVYQGEGHGFRKPETILDNFNQIERFLKEYLLFG
jgi:dipeptidyl aminopeptidase/acylaminoacyl peptidase